MTGSRIQVVFFDAADTLFRIQGSVAELYLHYAEKHGYRRSGDSLSAIKTAFTRAFTEAPLPVFAATEPGAIKQSERLWWFDIVHNVFYSVVSTSRVSGNSRQASGRSNTAKISSKKSSNRSNMPTL